VARLRAKRETWESLHMLPGVQRVWGNEPSHSEVNSHVGSWSPELSPDFSKRNFRRQNSSPWNVIYIIENILKLICLKWACIAHLDIYNTSYGQKKDRESDWQFDSRPLKSQESTQFPCMQATCDIPLKSSRRGLQLCFKLHCDRRFAQEVTRPQNCKSPSCCNFGTFTWESRDKKPFECGPRGEA
jgi:hypothetical protein